MVRWPHWRDNINVRFSVFLDFRKVGKFAASIERPKAKSVLASGWLHPPDQRLCPWTLPPDPCYRCGAALAMVCPPTFKYLPRSLNEHFLISCINTGWSKNVPTCFSQNFVESPPNFIILGTQMAKKIELCEVHSLSTSPHKLGHFLDYPVLLMSYIKLSSCV